jgi:hypothetical protein
VEANDPSAPPAGESLKPLGSLAQSARGKELNQARGILIIIGLLTLIVNVLGLWSVPGQIQQLIKQQQIAPADVEEFRQAVMISAYLIYGSAALLGLLFVVFGVIIKKFPVAITVTSLVLYILAMVGFGLLDPETLARGFIVKIIIIFALFRAIQAARAFQAHAHKPKFAEELL